MRCLSSVPVSGQAPTPSVIGRASIPTLIGQAPTAVSRTDGSGSSENQQATGDGNAPCVQASAPAVDTAVL